jgi:hypothetical protein
MGSFATSLHVRANDSSTVADALRRLLLDEGYETTEEEPERGFPMAPPSSLRAIQLSTSSGGWVSLLDSEGIYSQNLAAGLSGQLQTHAIQFFVNDSDSWHYQLFHAGEQIDEFDSSPDEDDDESLAGMGDMGSTTQAAEVQRIILERAQQMQQQLSQQMPPHLRELRQKLMTTGQATAEEMQAYSAWMQTQMPNLMEQLRELRSMRANLLSSESESGANNDHLRKHLPHLRPLLKEEVKDSRVLEILGEETTFAEGTLSKFLPLLGIASFYANLSYSYVSEHTSADLARKSIQLSEHLRFKKSSGHRSGPLRIHR